MALVNIDRHKTTPMNIPKKTGPFPRSNLFGFNHACAPQYSRYDAVNESAREAAASAEDD